MDATIQLLEHTNGLIDFFSTSRVAVTSIHDDRIRILDNFLAYLMQWHTKMSSPRHFISDKLFFDLQSMIHSFKAVVKIKLTRFSNSKIKAWILNQDVIENHFCQIRACNGQNNNPSYRLQESTHKTPSITGRMRSAVNQM